MGKHLTRQDLIDIGYIPTLKNIAMKMKFYNPETCAEPKKSKDLHMILRKRGSITFNMPACKSIGLEKGSKVELCQDDESKTWYFFKSQKGFELRSLGQQIGFSSVRLVNMVWSKQKEEDKSIRLIIAEDPIQYDGLKLHMLSIPKL